MKQTDEDALDVILLKPGRWQYDEYLKTKLAIRQLIAQARIDELSCVQLEHGRYVTGTFIDGKVVTIMDRINQLKARAITTSGEVQSNAEGE